MWRIPSVSTPLCRRSAHHSACSLALPSQSVAAVCSLFSQPTLPPALTFIPLCSLIHNLPFQCFRSKRADGGGSQGDQQPSDGLEWSLVQRYFFRRGRISRGLDFFWLIVRQQLWVKAWTASQTDLFATEADFTQLLKLLQNCWSDIWEILMPPLIIMSSQLNIIHSMTNNAWIKL